MNTDSSQMLYPDFTANMQSLPVVQAGDYYDVNDARAGKNAKKHNL